MTLLLIAAVGLVMAARFPMDPVSTPPAQMSHAGRMHGVAFLLGVPSMVLAVLVLSLALGGDGSPRTVAASDHHWSDLDQPREHDGHHAHGRSWEAAGSERTRTIRGLAEPVADGGVCRVADRRGVAARSRLV